MKIAVSATDEQWNELTGSRNSVNWFRVEDSSAFYELTDVDAFFSLQEYAIVSDPGSLKKPVFINSVVQTLSELKAAPNVYRINGWNSFLKNSVWEISGMIDDDIISIFNAMNIRLNKVLDEPGFITARIIAMIINEAYFAVEDQVSSKNEIDTAMKLGTNYPYGPFEWAALIGKDNILALLRKLTTTDTRYQASGLLTKDVTDIT